MSIWLAISLIIIIAVLVIPFRFEILLDLKLLKLTGNLEIKVFNFSAFKTKVRVKKGYIYITVKKKTKKLRISNKDINFIFIKKLLTMLYFRQNFTEINVKGEFGYKDDAFKTAMICGIFDNIVTTFVYRLKNHKQDANILRSLEPKYDRDTFSIFVSSKFNFSIFDLLFSLAISIIRVLGDKNEKRKRQQRLLTKNRVTNRHITR